MPRGKVLEIALRARRPADFGQRAQTREGLPIDARLSRRPFAPHVALHAEHMAAWASGMSAGTGSTA